MKSLPSMATSVPSLSWALQIRMILTVPDPDAVFAAAIMGGASEVYPVTEGHGWRVGRSSIPTDTTGKLVVPSARNELGLPTSPRCRRDGLRGTCSLVPSRTVYYNCR